MPEEEPELLSRIIRIFKDIPENSTLDIFGEIYEYFLGNFALAEGKDGGAFYTPSTVVRYMVEVLSPEAGGEKKFLDKIIAELIQEYGNINPSNLHEIKASRDFCVVEQRAIGREHLMHARICGLEGLYS